MKWTDKGHQYDVIGNKLKNKKKVYIFGAGEIGQYIYERISFLNCVEGFIDNNLAHTPRLGRGEWLLS